jgi:hypothetical protein
MPTMPKTPGIFFERIGNFTGSVDDFCMAVYVIEMVLKMYVFRKEVSWVIIPPDNPGFFSISKIRGIY